MEDLHKFWKHRWLTPKARVFKSKIFGYGPHAIQNIKKGELIRVTGGIIIPKKDIKKYHKKMGFAAEVQVDDNFFIAPSDDKERKDTGLFNHSCDPNVGFLDSIRIIAIRNVKKGEELCLDYAFFGGAFEPFKCKCGSVNCRKIIKPDDWKITEIQRKYGQYFSPYLKKKIKLNMVIE
jgi:SET domain-containing protein